jgi:hypothetical protein
MLRDYKGLYLEMVFPREFDECGSTYSAMAWLYLDPICMDISAVRTAVFQLLASLD